MFILTISGLQIRYCSLREHKGGSIPPFFIIDRLCRYRTRPQIVIYVGRVLSCQMNECSYAKQMGTIFV